MRKPYWVLGGPSWYPLSSCPGKRAAHPPSLVTIWGEKSSTSRRPYKGWNFFGQGFQGFKSEECLFNTGVSVELEKKNILWQKMQSSMSQSKRRVIRGATQGKEIDQQSWEYDHWILRGHWVGKRLWNLKRRTQLKSGLFLWCVWT